MDTDLELQRWLENHQKPYVVVATKMDKVKNQSEMVKSVASLRKGADEPMLCSATTGRGVREIWQAITKTRRQ
jgi:GTP-binding protein